MPVEPGLVVLVVAVLISAAVAAALIGRAAARLFLRASGDRPTHR